MILDYKIRRDIVKVAKRLYIKGLNTSYSGNISSKGSWPNSFWITPRQIDKFSIRPDDLALIDIITGEKIMGGEPSSEVRMHIEIYRKRKDISSIVHAHSPYTLAMARKSYIDDIMEELYELKFYIGKLAIVEPIKPGTVELAKAVSEALRGNEITTVILKNHGVVSVGKNIYDALNRIEVLEHAALVKSLYMLLT